MPNKETVSREEYLRRADKVDGIFNDFGKTLSRIDKNIIESVSYWKGMYEALKIELHNHMREDEIRSDSIEKKIAEVDSKVNQIKEEINKEFDIHGQKIDSLIKSNSRIIRLAGAVSGLSGIIGYFSHLFF